MALPGLTHLAAHTDANPKRLSPAAAAMTLGLSRGSLNKITNAGVLEQPFVRDAVVNLAARPTLGVTEGGITVLRTTSATEARPETPPRTRIGFDASMANDELEDANLRWWRGDAQKILDNEIFVPAIGSIPVAVYRLTGIADRKQDGREVRYWFEGELLARLETRPSSGQGENGGPLLSLAIHPWQISSPQPRSHPLLPLAMKIMESRVFASSGGPIGYLNAAQ